MWVRMCFIKVTQTAFENTVIKKACLVLNVKQKYLWRMSLQIFDYDNILKCAMRWPNFGGRLSNATDTSSETLSLQI